MLNIGTGELFLVLLVALLVFGPARLPEIARNLGKALRQFQQETQKATAILKEGFDAPPATSPPAASPASFAGPAPGVVDVPDESVVVSVPAEPAPPAPEVTQEIRQHEDT